MPEIKDKDGNVIISSAEGTELHIEAVPTEEVVVTEETVETPSETTESTCTSCEA